MFAFGVVRLELLELGVVSGRVLPAGREAMPDVLGTETAPALLAWAAFCAVSSCFCSEVTADSSPGIRPLSLVTAAWA
jgi:hypothetical protein